MNNIDDRVSQKEDNLISSNICPNCGAKLILKSVRQKLVICSSCNEQCKIERKTVFDKVIAFAERRLDIKRQDKIAEQKRINEEKKQKEELERQREEEERKRAEELERQKEEEERQRLEKIEMEKEEKKQKRIEWWKKYWWIIALIFVFCLIYSLICDLLGVEV